VSLKASVEELEMSATTCCMEVLSALELWTGSGILLTPHILWGLCLFDVWLYKVKNYIENSFYGWRKIKNIWRSKIV